MVAWIGKPEVALEDGQPDALGDHLHVGIEDRAAEVEALADDVVVGGLDHRDPHALGGGVERGADHLDGDGVDRNVSHAHPPRGGDTSVEYRAGPGGPQRVNRRLQISVIEGARSRLHSAVDPPTSKAT